MPKKNEKGDHLVSFGFVGYVEKVKNEKGPFGLSLPWPDLALGGFRNVSKTWTDQCEGCGLTKKIKKGHFYSRAFFLERKMRRLKMELCGIT